MMLVISTQVHENYAAHDWDGNGTCPQYWKAKGGADYKITNIPLNIDYLAVVALAGLEGGNDYFREEIIDWKIEGDDYLSWFEKSQLDYEGTITHKEPTIDYSTLKLNGSFA